jgi:squalene-associated FAD-dependent desaturase
VSGPLSGRHVAVVGGGLAGISAALNCADRGARVTLVERQRRLGGLTWSFERNGIWMDNGQHVYLACCDAYVRFLDRIGAASDVVTPKPLDIPVVAPSPTGPKVGRLRRRDLPVPLHLAGSLMTYPHVGLADRLKLGRALAGLARLDLDDPGLDRLTFGEWLARRGQSHRAVAAVWDLITVPTVNLPASEASLAVAAMVFKTGLLSDRSAADIGWSRVPLGRLHGDRAAGALARAGVEVRTGVRVTGVAMGTGGGWEVGTADGPVGADGVVVAVPHDEAAAVIPLEAAAARGRWTELGYSSVVDVHLVFDRAVTEWEVMAGHASDVQWVFDRTAASGLDQVQTGAQYLAVSLSAADRYLGRRPEDLVGSTVSALTQLLPSVAGAQLVDSVVTKERTATFRATPGTGAIRPATPTARPGLVLAGAWTATGWPATMEGAVRSGRSAAEALCCSTPEARSNPKAPSNTDHSLPQEVA